MKLQPVAQQVRTHLDPHVLAQRIVAVRVIEWAKISITRRLITAQMTLWRS